MLRRLLDRELGVVKHNDRLGRPPPRVYLLQRPVPDFWRCQYRFQYSRIS